MTVNVIYNKIQVDDYDRLIKEFNEQSVEYKFWDAIMMDYKAVEGINASHKMIVRWAKENNMSEVIIAEQDVTFTSPKSWEYFIDNKPKDFDLYLWGSYVKPLSSNLVCGFHLYIISEKFYDKFLSVPENVHIDTEMDKLKGDYKFCYPFPALQRVGWSSNNGAVVNYNSILTTEDIYT